MLDLLDHKAPEVRLSLNMLNQDLDSLVANVKDADTARLDFAGLNSRASTRLSGLDTIKFGFSVLTPRLLLAISAPVVSAHAK